MEIEERLYRLHSHIKEHPADYQAVIAEVKLRSDLIEHQAYLRTIDRLKRVAEIRKERKEYEEQRKRNGAG